MANGGSTTSGSGLAAVNSVVVLMLENRSFDHMLGFLYPGNVSPSGQPFDGLTGTESNPGSSGQPVTVFGIEPTTPSAYFMPGADPGDGYMAANDQLYGSTSGPASSGQAATCQGFVANYAYTLGWQSKEKRLADRAGHGRGRHHGLFHAASAVRAGRGRYRLAPGGDQRRTDLPAVPRGHPGRCGRPPPRLTRPPASS